MELAIVVLCVEIFLCRIVDVSLATLRMMLTVKEKPVPAALIGFVESMIWFLVVREALTTEGGIWAGIAYAAGFATGTFIGGLISRRFIKGNVMVQVVTHKSEEMVAAIRTAGYGVSVVNVNGSDYGDEKYMLFCEIGNGSLPDLKKLVHKHDEGAFIMVQDTKVVYNGFIK